MNEITTLFTAIGDFFTQSDWFSMVKWPFWILLSTVAVGGIYCARFGKKTLLNLGIGGTLNLLAIYLGTAIAYIYIVPLRDMFSELPFLSVSDEGVSLVDPFTMNLAGLAPLLLRLMILTFLVNTADSFRTGGKTMFSWLFSQLVTVLIALVLYAIFTAGISLILPEALNRFAIIPVVLIVAAGILILCGKFIFTVFISGGNPYFSSVYKFFTVNKGGSLFTISSVSFLLSLAVLSVLHIAGCTSLNYATANTTGLWIILAMLLAGLYIFCMYYSDRKKT